MNASRKNPQRIFIFGSPRSGTTLLQSMFAAHSQVLGFTESHFFDKGFRKSPFARSWSVQPALDPRIRAFFEQNDSTSFSTPTSLLDSMTGDAKSIAHRLIEFFDECAVTQNKSVWIEKTPDHVRRIGLLSTAAPEAKFVHVARLPVDTILSLRKAKAQWGGKNSWLHCFGHWYSAMTCSRLCIGKNNHFFVTYEDLTKDPERVMKKLFGELDLAWEPDLDQKRVEATQSLVRADEKWKANNFTQVKARPPASDKSLPVWLRLILRRTRIYKTLRSAAVVNSTENDATRSTE